MSGTDHKAVVHCTPIYDWSELDIFKYLGEQGIRYCGLYDAQLYSRANFRVSTPIHTAAAKRLAVWRKLDPDFYGRVIAVFPEMLAQERYYFDLDYKYEQSFDAAEEWIAANVPEGKQPRVMIALNAARKEHEKTPLTESEWKFLWNKLVSGTWLKGMRNFTARRQQKRK
jgi:3'-phosphoadenosine 5'-phosphosulfate sulfotransferase (PAPS reductase)/FAD synthetase